MMKNINKNGFSLIEVLIVMAIIAIVSSVLLIETRPTRIESALDASTATIFYSLEEARSKAVAGLSNEDHDVITNHCLLIKEKVIIPFMCDEKGNPIEPIEEKDAIPLRFAIVDGVGDDGIKIRFERLTGKPFLTPAINNIKVIYDPDLIPDITGNSRSITVNEEGVIEYGEP